MSEQVPNLASLGLVGAPAESPEVPAMTEDEGIATLVALMESVNVSLEAQKTEIQAMKTANARLTLELRFVKGRMSTMETLVSYLSMNDPGVKDRMLAMAAANKAAEEAENAPNKG